MPNISQTLARQMAVYGSASERAIPMARRDLAGLEEQLATGRRVNRASDDPSAFGQARRLEHLEQRYDGFLETNGDARLWIDATQSALANLTELVTTAQEELTRANTGTFNTDDHAIVAGKLRALLAEGVDTLNQKVGEEYLFAGNRTDVQPFNADGTPNAPLLADLGGDRTRQVAPGTLLKINASGEQVQDTGAGFTVTEALNNAIAILEGGPGTLDAALGDVLTARDHLLNQSTAVGENARRLDTAEVQVQDAKIIAASRRSGLEDADFAEVAMQLQQKQGMMEAALRVTASTNQMTLLDYIR